MTHTVSRRGFLVSSLFVLAGCAPAASPAPTSAPSKPAETKPAAPAAQPAATTAPAAAKPAESKPAEAAKPAGPLRKVKMSQATVSLPYAPFYIAQSKGFFAGQGLEVEMIATGGGGPDLQALISGDVEFNGAGGTYQSDALRQGQKIITIYNIMDKPVINVAMHVDVAKEKGITEQSPLKDKLAALKGLKIGATRPGAATFQQAEYMARGAGLKPQEDVQILGAGEGAALIAALETRQVDVILQSIPIAEQAVARGKAIMLVNYARGEDPSLVPFNSFSLYIRPDTAEKDPELVQKFVNGVKQATDWMLQAPPEEIVPVIRPNFEQMDPAVLLAGATSIKAATNKTGILEKKSVENLLAMQGQTGADEVHALFVDKFIKAAK
jgi:NitT/TauT family transport system substrate-binding protein